jgi:hypothetical protein
MVVNVGGFVRSIKQVCIESRYVEVYAGDVLYGADPATDTTGAWEISGSAPTNQTYTLKVLRKRLPTGEAHAHICSGDSKKMSF